MSAPGFQFTPGTPMMTPDMGRTGVITTAHGTIRTPAFIPVATKATLKTVLPAAAADLGAQALLANAYHLYLQPGTDVIEDFGGLGPFMGWDGPTFTDSGGFQVLSLGVGFKKVLSMQAAGVQRDDVIADGHERLAHVDDDGVTFKSHLNGSLHRFTPEVSMQVQYAIGADIAFAFDECTTLLNTRAYQQASVARTHKWAVRCLEEHGRLRDDHPERPYQALFGVVQGAQYEDLRRQAARGLAELGFDGFGIGGALEKSALGQIVGWVAQELPAEKPRHLLGIGDPDDLFAGVAAGADTFDCVTPSRVARNGAVFSPTGRFNIRRAAHRRENGPISTECRCYTCGHHSRAYLHHLFKAKEMLGFTLATIHNVHFLVDLVDRIRESIENDEFAAFRAEFLGRYYGA